MSYRKPGQYVKPRFIPSLQYDRTRVPIKYREHTLPVYTLLIATSSIGVLSYIGGRVDDTTTATLAAVAGVVAGFSAAITAWQSESGAHAVSNCMRKPGAFRHSN